MNLYSELSAHPNIYIQIFKGETAEKAKFRLDPRRSPERVFERRPFDQLTNLLIDLRTAERSPRLPSPVELEALPVLFDDGLRFNGLTMIKTSRQFFQNRERITQKNRSRRWSCGR